MKTKVWYKYVIVGYIAGFMVSLAGMLFEDYEHNITILIALSSFHHFIAPIVLGGISGFFGFMYWKRKTAQDEAIKNYAKNLHSLLNVNTALLSTIELDLVLQTIIDESTHLTNLDTGAIYLHENEKLFMGATTPPLPPEFPDIMRYDLLSNHPNIQTSLKTKQPVIIEDTALAILSDAEMKVVKYRGLRSIIYIPLIIENRPIGTLILGTTNELRKFSSEEINIYNLFSGQAALAIENALLYKDSLLKTNELRQQNEEFLTLNEELSEGNLKIQAINEELKRAKEQAEANEQLIQKQLQDLQASEKELANTRILMQAAFDQSPVPMVVVTTPDFTFKIINKATEEFLLVDASNYLNKRPSDLEREWLEYTMDGNPVVSVADLPLPLALQGITTKNKEMIIERRDGSRVVELASGSPIYGVNGELIAGMLVMVDLTERKLVEEKLKESERILRLKNEEYEALNEELKETNEALYTAKLKAEDSKSQIEKQLQELQSTEEEIRAANEELSATTDALIESNAELQAAKERAEENEMRFKALFENMNNSASHYEVIYDKQGMPCDYRFLNINKAYQNNIGFKPEDVIGKTLLEVFPATEQVWLDTFKQVVLTSKPGLIESYAREVNMYFELIVYVPEKGKLAMIGSNVTERKLSEIEVLKAKEKAEESEKNFSLLFQNMPLNFTLHELVFDETGKPCDFLWLDLNPSAEKAMGLKASEIAGKSNSELYPGTPQAWVDYYAKIATSGISDHSVIFSPHLNKYFDTRNYSPKYGQIASLGIDITERKLAEEKLKETNALLRIAGEKAKLGGWSINLEHNQVIWSDEVALIHETPAGYSPKLEEALGFYAPEWREKITNHFNDCAKNGIPYDEDMEIITANKNRVWVRAIGEAVKNNEGKIIKVQGAFQDITERKNAEAALISAKQKAEESDQLKTAFLENISHEVRTPMNAILGFSELMLKHGLANEKRKQFTDVLQSATHQLLTVVENTITLAHIKTNQLQINKMEFCPADVLANLFDEYSHKKQLIGKSHIQLHINEPESRVLQIKNDFTRINQIFSILLDNAFKFTEKGSIEFGYTVIENSINFFVKDTGIGIPPEKQQIIFKSFAQADKNIRQLFGGLGVGLSIAMGLVNILEGKITINSELNVGTEITFSLPLTQEIKTLQE